MLKKGEIKVLSNTREDLIKELRKLQESLTDEERLEFWEDLIQGYCKYCASNNPSCQCWRDE